MRVLFGLACLALAVTAGELLSWQAGRFLQKRWSMFAVPRAPAGRSLAYPAYLDRRDPELGWPYPDEIGGNRYDATGARPSVAFPVHEGEPSCVAVFGDSFVQSPQPDARTWAEELGRLLGCRVANFGVGGYGTDQALLRSRRPVPQAAPVVVLAHTSEDITRNLTRNRDLVNYERWYAYKPRFVLDAGGRLEVVPLPALSPRDHERLIGVTGPQLDLPHESFHPGGPAGAVRLSFPFTFAIVRNLGDFRMRARLAREPEYAALYQPGHALGGLELTREILLAFTQDAQRRGQAALVVLFPTVHDVAHAQQTGEWYYGPLARELARSDVPTADFGPRLLERTGAGDPAAHFDATGHFSAETDALVAGFLLPSLRKMLAPDAQAGRRPGAAGVSATVRPARPSSAG